MKQNLLYINERYAAFFKYPLITTFCMGCLTALSLPPIGAFPALLMTVSYLLIALRNFSISPARAFLFGWLFGAGYFLVGQYWIAAAFVELFRFHFWLMTISLFLVPTILGLLWGCATTVSHYFRHTPIWHALICSSFLALAEYLRSQDYIFHYTWNIFGYAIYRLDGLLQLSSIVGIYGLTVVAFLFASLPYLWLSRSKENHLNAIVSILFAILLLSFIWGETRLHKETNYNPEISVEIVQPNLPQFKKDDDIYRDENIAELSSLLSSQSSATQSKVLTVFPETMFTINSGDKTAPLLYKRIGSTIQNDGIAAIGIRQNFPQKSGDINVKNGLVFLDKGGNVLSLYNKHILAPWGETSPYKSLLEKTFLSPLFIGKATMTAGDPTGTIRLDGFPAISPQICYESAYPNYTPSGPDRPDVVILASNDEISSKTSQPYQSFLQTRVRAIETGIPILRAANSGISAIIDAKGQVLQSLGMNEKGVLKAQLPLADEAPLYGRFGDAPFLVFVLLTFLAALVSRKNKKQLA